MRDASLHGFLLIAPIFIISLTLHELAHAATAYLLGDRSAQEMGRLTLNPLAHLDPLGSLVLVVTYFSGTSFLFGWAKPVMVDPRNLRTAPQAGMALVGAAGPATNFLLALAAGGVWAHTELTGDALEVVYWAIVVNVSLGIFNLLPIPPLDGSRIIGGFMPRAGLRAVVGARPVRHVRDLRARDLLPRPDVEPARRRLRRRPADHLGDRRRLPADLMDAGLGDARRHSAPVRPRGGRDDRVHDAAGRRLERLVRGPQPRLRDAGRSRRRGREPPPCARRGRRRPAARGRAAPGARARRDRGRRACARRLPRPRRRLARGRRPRHLGAGPGARRARRRLPHRSARRVATGRASSTVHAGWRGLVAGVLEAAAERRRRGLRRSGRAGRRCVLLRRRRGRRRRSCARASATMSSPAGAPIWQPARGVRSSAPAHVPSRSPGCARSATPERFHSHRRDGAGSGRQGVIAFIGGSDQ